MLNRLYIVLGVLAILAITAAFVVPSFIDWGAYRERMAQIAGEVLGTPVRIEGDVKFTLLPQPRLQFSKVSAGPPDRPQITAANVVAEFSLVDFLRDRYTVTRLDLDSPYIVVDVDEKGAVNTGIAVPERVSVANISIANATVTNGTVELRDARTRGAYVAERLEGDLKLDALRGPFSFQGSAVFDGTRHAIRITAGKLEGGGGTQLSGAVRPENGRYSLNVEGRLLTGALPRFSGNMTYRQAPANVKQPEAQDVGQGDLVMTGKVEATPDKVVVSEYVVVPDENRAATRLQGAVEVKLGASSSFNAVISGGALGLAPRDATAEQTVQPYELVRLLAELPVPPPPAMEGTVGIDIAEFDVRAVSLRDVRIDARAENGGWTVKEFSSRLPGESTLKLDGRVSQAFGRTEFSGTLSLTSKNLDALSTLWRKPAEGNPLIGMGGGLKAKVDLVGGTLSLSQGQLTLDGETRSFSAQIGLANSRDLHLTADLGQLDPVRSSALLALVPDPTRDIAFPVTFPKGEFNLVADTMTVAGLTGRALRATGSWEGGVLVFDKVSAGDLGGASFDLSFTAFGSFAKPELSGSGSIQLLSAKAPFLEAVYNGLGTPEGVRNYLASFMPADLALKLGAPSGEGAQSLLVSGKVGPSELDADAQLAAGFLRALSGSLRLRVDLRSAEAQAAAAQLGIASISLFPAGQPLHLVAVATGDIANSLETTIRVDSGEDFAGFSGNVVVGNTALSGRGTLKATLSDPSALAELVGAQGISIPPLSGSATLEFAGARSIRLNQLQGVSGSEPFSGSLEFKQAGESGAVSGSLSAGKIDLAGLVRTLAGPAALLNSGGIWPDGPLAGADEPRKSNGRIKVTSPALTVDETHHLENVTFALDWDATSLGIRAFSGSLGSGQVGYEVSLCCAGPLPDKQVTGRFNVSGIEIDSIVPPAVAAAMGGKLEASGQFNGTGDSVAGVLAAMTGQGAYRVEGLTIERLDPSAVTAITGLESVVDKQREELAATIEAGISAGRFVAPAVSGSFTIAGGVLRSPNVSAQAETGELFGSSQLRLEDLGLSGSYLLSATGVRPAALVGTNDAKVTAALSGTLINPQRSFDVSGVVDAIMVKAYEAEVARLEKLRAEDEARQKAEAEMRALLAKEEADRQAAEKKAKEEEAARKAAQEKAAADKAAADKAAADEEAAQRAADQAAARRAAEEALGFNGEPMDLLSN